MALKGSTVRKMLSSSVLPSSANLQLFKRGRHIHHNANSGSATNPTKIDIASGPSTKEKDTRKPLIANFAVRADWSDGSYGYFNAAGRVYWNNGENDHKALAVTYKASGERVIYSAVECPQNRDKQHLLEYLSFDKREHDIPTKESLLKWIKSFKLNNGARKARIDQDASLQGNMM